MDSREVARPGRQECLATRGGLGHGGLGYAERGASVEMHEMAGERTLLGSAHVYIAISPPVLVCSPHCPTLSPLKADSHYRTPDFRQ